MSRKAKDKPKGQVMILVAMLAMTFIFFFKFVVDTGVLIVAKINLQNAADLAAYSGAASQARLLNQIGFLNYDMRKAYKKFLYEYYVLGTSGQDSFPKSKASGIRKYQPNNTDNPIVDYQVPVVCIDYQNMTDNAAQKSGVASNNCRISKKQKIPKINFALQGAMGDIYNTFVENLNKQVGTNGCPLFAANNLATLASWLYNADPAHKAINDAEALYQAEAQKDPSKDNPLRQAVLIFQMMKSMMPGMGLVPRLYINQLRIQTLAEYLNKAPNTLGVTLQDVDALSKTKDPAANERIIEAFYSAYNTLGPYLFETNSIKLEELQPGNDKTPYVNLNLIKTDFTTYFLDSPVDPNDSESCLLVPRAVNVNDLVIGVSKDPAVQTYYAVRLKANANMIYWPTKSFQLKAYAAARPFGGYIGPDQIAYEKLNMHFNKKCPSPTGIPKFLTMTTDQSDCSQVKPVPNTMLAQSDLNGYDDLVFQNRLFEEIQSNSKVDPIKVFAGADYAQIPNPAEKNLFLIPNDASDGKDADSYQKDTHTHSHEIKGDPFNHYFHPPKQPDANGAKFFIYHFWAPIISPSNANAIDMVKSELKDRIKKATTSKSGFSGVMDDRINQMSGILSDSVDEYMTKIYGGGADNGQGELHESLNIAAIGDFTKPAHSQILKNNIDWKAIENPRYFMTDAKNLRTSWVTSKDDHIFNEGRVGYSVKIVRLKELTGKGADSKASGDGRGQTATNVLQPDPEMQGDGSYDYLEH